MAEKIQIDAGPDQSITALHGTPNELSTTRLDQTLVLMSHGFPGHKESHCNIFGAIERALTQRGYHTLRFDYRGCGESDGREENFTLGSACEDYQAVLYWAKAKGYKRFIYIGEGLGASLAIMNIDLDVRGCILLWPVLDLSSHAKSCWSLTEPSAEDIRRGFVLHDNYRIGLNLYKELGKIDIVYAIKEMFMPTIVFHGAKDAQVPITGLDMARRYIPAKRLEIMAFHDGEHGLNKENHRKAIMFQILQFAEKYI